MNKPKMHRIAEVRKSQDVTIRNVSRILGITIDTAKEQEQPEQDLKISELQGWQRVLKVPISELLVEIDSGFSGPVLDRSRVVRLMRTAVELKNANSIKKIRTLSQNLIGQLLEIMPELAPMIEDEPR